MSERIYLDVPFDEKDQAKHLGARWDPDQRRWWVDAASARPDLLHRWLPSPPPTLAGQAATLPQPSYDGPTVAMLLLGLTTSCWKCGHATTAVVGLLGAGGDEYDMLDGTDPDTLAAVTSLLRSDLRESWRIGAVKPRYSRTVGYRYLSNGCYHCDAILGAVPLNDEVADVLATEGLAGLNRIDVLHLPQPVHRRLLAEHYVEFADLDDTI